jgi:hypothetical protein
MKPYFLRALNHAKAVGVENPESRSRDDPVVLVDEKEVIRALSSSCADPAVRERVHPWGPDRRLEDSGLFGPEDVVERTGERRVSIPLFVWSLEAET